jgi:acetyl-CoA C-acetyltransferase
MTSNSTRAAIDPRTPVIVGVGQVIQKTADFDGAMRPVELMIEAVRVAAADSGSPGVAGKAGAVGVVSGLWDYDEPGRLVADAFGATDAKTAVSTFSGSMAQHMVTEYAKRIQDGALDVAIITGGEAYYSEAKRGEKPADLSRVSVDASKSDELFGDPLPLFSKHEYKMGFSLPLVVYPMFGSAVRAQRRQSQDSYRDEISSMWADFSQVAAANPSAWDRDGHSASEIREPSPDNRMVCWPYTKSMNANMFVDQAAAIVICSNAQADEMGVALDRRVFPLGAADGGDPASFTERLEMHSSPAIRLGGAAALELAGLSIGEIDHFDLYSCFPSIVQISTAELGVPEGRQLTQTGGLSFFGGPLNSYTLHAIASMVDTLRSHPGDSGLVHGNGGHMSKQSICVYGTTPPAEFRKADVQAEIDALPHRALDAEYVGAVTVESCTALFGKNGPVKGFATGLTDRGNRVLAVTDDEATMEAITVKELVGESASVDAERSLHL